MQHLIQITLLVQVYSIKQQNYPHHYYYTTSKVGKVELTIGERLWNPVICVL